MADAGLAGLDAAIPELTKLAGELGIPLAELLDLIPMDYLPVAGTILRPLIGAITGQGMMPSPSAVGTLPTTIGGLASVGADLAGMGASAVGGAAGSALAGAGEALASLAGVMNPIGLVMLPAALIRMASDISYARRKPARMKARAKGGQEAIKEVWGEAIPAFPGAQQKLAGLAGLTPEERETALEDVYGTVMDQWDRLGPAYRHIGNVHDDAKGGEAITKPYYATMPALQSDLWTGRLRALDAAEEYGIALPDTEGVPTPYRGPGTPDMDFETVITNLAPLAGFDLVTERPPETRPDAYGTLPDETGWVDPVKVAEAQAAAAAWSPNEVENWNLQHPDAIMYDSLDPALSAGWVPGDYADVAQAALDAMGEWQDTALGRAWKRWAPPPPVAAP